MIFYREGVSEVVGTVVGDSEEFWVAVFSRAVFVVSFADSGEFIFRSRIVNGVETI